MTKQRAVGIRETALFWTNKTEAFQSLGRAVRNDSTSRCNSLFFALAACASAPIPTTWIRTDGRPSDPTQLETDKTICRGEMEQAELVTNARGLVAIQCLGKKVLRSRHMSTAWPSGATQLLDCAQPYHLNNRGTDFSCSGEKAGPAANRVRCSESA